MATYTLKRLVDPQQLTTTGTNLYQCPINTTTTIKEILVANASSSNAAVTINLAPVGSVNTGANQIIPGVVISPNSTLTLDITQVMNAGDRIFANASVANSLNICISGYESA
jgi:hypothetical protein